TNDIDVGILEIYADPVRPTHGDRVKFDIHLFNSGYKTAVINITANNSKSLIPLTNPFFNGSHTIFGRSPLRVPLYWDKCGPGGTWPIKFNATVLNGFDVDPTNNVMTINFTIMPTILFVDDIEKIDVYHLGRQIRYHRFFSPEGTNVDFVQILSKNCIFVRTYERGVENETLSCGTGATAAAVVAAIKGYVNTNVECITKSGEVLKISFKKNSPEDMLSPVSNVYLEGKVYHIFDGEFYL
ncbi:MAG: hypothetical protein N2Z73_00520, partial [Endomicrobia bacterium]|nr:hypothetical protein [Endomicrobiia bacterium]